MHLRAATLLCHKPYVSIRSAGNPLLTDELATYRRPVLDQLDAAKRSSTEGAELSSEQARGEDVS